MIGIAALVLVVDDGRIRIPVPVVRIPVPPEVVRLVLLVLPPMKGDSTAAVDRSKLVRAVAVDDEAGIHGDNCCRYGWEGERELQSQSLFAGQLLVENQDRFLLLVDFSM